MQAAQRYDSPDDARRRAAFLTGARGRLAAAACLAAGVGFAVAGTLSTFTASGTKAQSLASGTFAFNLADPSGGPFSTAVSGMAPGDFADRTVNLVNPAGDLNYGSVALAASATASSLLNSSETEGLTLTVSDCSIAWTQATSSSAATCSGTEKTLTAAKPLSKVISEGVSYSSGLASLTGGGTDYLRFHYSLPAADTLTSGLSSEIRYTFTAAQATGGAYH